MSVTLEPLEGQKLYLTSKTVLKPTTLLLIKAPEVKM